MIRCGGSVCLNELCTENPLDVAGPQNSETAMAIKESVHISRSSCYLAPAILHTFMDFSILEVRPV